MEKMMVASSLWNKKEEIMHCQVKEIRKLKNNKNLQKI
jgi:hypothetical protein